MTATTSPALLEAATRRAEYVLAALAQAELAVTAPDGAAPHCPECSTPVAQIAGTPAEDDHELIEHDGETRVLVGCEGYFVANPALFGLDAGHWDDFRAYPAGTHLEAVCGTCDETFLPHGETPEDLEHGIREDGEECGGAGVIVGHWTTTAPALAGVLEAHAAETAARRGAGVKVLLDLIEEAEGDHLEILEALKPILVDDAFRTVCESLEVCPVHLCDEQICRDDSAACPSGKDAR